MNVLSRISTASSALDALVAHSRDLEAEVTRRLHAFCDDDSTHARFLNMLSLMEHVGSRKIMLSQAKGELPQDTLKHLAEETRHAFFFKRAAENLAGRALDYGPRDTMAGASARMYMARLDGFIAKHLAETRGAGANPAPSETAYLYMSLIVELRAIWFYRLYQKVLTERKSKLSLKSILAEEEMHLEEMWGSLSKIDTVLVSHAAHFSASEKSRFDVLWKDINKEHC